MLQRSMNGRERVEAALRFEEPDRVPIDLAGMRSTGIHAFALAELRRALGLEARRIHVYDPHQMLGFPEDDVRERLHVDVIGLEEPRRDPGSGSWSPWSPREGLEVLIPDDVRPERKGGDSWVLRNARGEVEHLMSVDGFYFDSVVGPLAPRRLPSVDEYRPGGTYADEQLDELSARADFLYENTDYAILGSFFGGNLFDLNVGGMANWMMLVASEPERARQYVEKACDAMIGRAGLAHQAVGGKVFALVIGNDMGTQRSELYSPETFESVNAPGYKRFCEWVHANTDFKVFLHSCGSIYNYIETLIDCGIDILNPVQTSAANMEPQRLKAEFGGRIVFWGGGCDTQHVLPNATPKEVREHVRERMEIFKPGGGFVFNQVHNIQPGCPVENIIAMLDAAYDYGGYA